MIISVGIKPGWLMLRRRFELESCSWCLYHGHDRALFIFERQIYIYVLKIKGKGEFL
jgi:hypothetical protein